MPEMRDDGLEFFLELNGYTYVEEDGYWAKFEVYRVDPSPAIPHGIRYSLTCHDKYNKRVLGFDNAHGVKLKRGKFGGRKITWDHKHLKERISSYGGITESCVWG